MGDTAQTNTWQPRKGAPPKLPGEARADYRQRVARERSARYRNREAAKKPATRVRSAAAEPIPTPEQTTERPRSKCPVGYIGFDSRDGTVKTTAGWISSDRNLEGGLTYGEFLDRNEAERELPPLPTGVVLTGPADHPNRAGYDPLDEHDIARMADAIIDFPGLGLEDIDINALRTALANFGVRGEPLDLTTAVA